MRINLNDKMIIGREIPRENAKPDFAVYATTTDKQHFLSLIKVLSKIEAARDLLVINEKTDCIFKLIDIYNLAAVQAAINRP